jgi:hypothetical protein
LYELVAESSILSDGIISNLRLRSNTGRTITCGKGFELASLKKHFVAHGIEGNPEDYTTQSIMKTLVDKAANAVPNIFDSLAKEETKFSEAVSSQCHARSASRPSVSPAPAPAPTAAAAADAAVPTQCPIRKSRSTVVTVPKPRVERYDPYRKDGPSEPSYQPKNKFDRLMATSRNPIRPQ